MKYCEKCKVQVRGDMKRCPLCQRMLVGEAEGGPLYPEVRTMYRQYRHFFKILIFSTIVAAVAACAVNLLLPQSGHWALFVVIGIAGLWISMYFAVHQRNSLPKNITYQAIFISVFSVIWDLVTHWHGWSINFAIPCTFAVAIISMTVLGRLMKIPAGEYLICLIIDIIFGFIPIVFYAIGIVDVKIPSIICISCSIISLAGIIVFQGDEIRRELTRRFHL
ncbi:DUF6320 domain-containing protein [Anaerovorax odorimutans]|uniref:DUF6320 domain-containing protein n=1 Tax=Anaerovorax odorimutans TaxID=109327 RepID=A0ABT1RMD4_9FIRM|nr:DUF6320 domain-containing protein [Anaerovorax odorimutans]MCQ4636332.1 DUF6320 domain-containing protein [Anaerovorax odorimutans]